jgi:hypothetical protein
LNNRIFKIYVTSQRKIKFELQIETQRIRKIFLSYSQKGSSVGRPGLSWPYSHTQNNGTSCIGLNNVYDYDTDSKKIESTVSIRLFCHSLSQILPSHIQSTNSKLSLLPVSRLYGNANNCVVPCVTAQVVCVCNKSSGMGALLEGTRVAHVTSEAGIKKQCEEDLSLNIQKAWHENISLQITIPPQSITLVTVTPSAVQSQAAPFK